MNEAFEMILERLQELQQEQIQELCEHKNFTGEMQSMRGHNVLQNVKKIIQKIVEDYNNGWILCSDRMPEEHDSIFAKLKGTDKWNDNMYEKVSDWVNVTVTDRYSNTITTYAHTVEGEWRCDLLRLDKSYKIIAWQPFPEPYHITRG